MDQLLVSYDTAKGIACETVGWNLASLAVGSTPRAKIMCLLALLDVRNAVSPCLHFLPFLLYEE